MDDIAGLDHRLAIESIEEYLDMPELSTGSTQGTKGVGEVVTPFRPHELQRLVIELFEEALFKSLASFSPSALL